MHDCKDATVDLLALLVRAHDCHEPCLALIYNQAIGDAVSHDVCKVSQFIFLDL